MGGGGIKGKKWKFTYNRKKGNYQFVLLNRFKLFFFFSFLPFFLENNQMHILVPVEFLSLLIKEKNPTTHTAYIIVFKNICIFITYYVTKPLFLLFNYFDGSYF